MLFFPEFLIPEKSNVDIFIHKKETAQNPFWVGLIKPNIHFSKRKNSFLSTNPGNAR